jgi:hypothetical protein
MSELCYFFRGFYYVHLCNDFVLLSVDGTELLLCFLRVTSYLPKKVRFREERQKERRKDGSKEKQKLRNRRERINISSFYLFICKRIRQ